MMAQSTTLNQQIDELQHLLITLLEANTIQDKITILNQTDSVIEYLNEAGTLLKYFLDKLPPSSEYAAKAIIAIHQGPIVFNMIGIEEKDFEKFKQLTEQLQQVEKFYDPMGGIIGYHLCMLKLICQQVDSIPPSSDSVKYIHPEGMHVNQDLPEVHQAIRQGIESLDQLFEMYPIGGAGDRLNLKDEITQAPLPAALLPFLGRTLLEGMLRDLQAREYLFFKLFGRQITTPIVLMTSLEKNNHQHILAILKKLRWFGRPNQSFFFCIQPSVPVLTHEGNWSLTAPLKLTLKPSGHGVLWKLAEEEGVFAKLEEKGFSKCLVRQVNNPIASMDRTILALSGLGCRMKKSFGFVSCERLLNCSEGINVIIQNKNSHGYDYCMTNIEYTEFKKRGIDETPLKPGSRYSLFSSNTNILFADISSIREALKKCPFPGQLINMKTDVPYIDPEGNRSFIPGGRLESTMQNIADCMSNHFSHRLNKEQFKTELQTFLIYNSRIKTISSTKKSYIESGSSQSTPEQAFYDLLLNHYHLLKECGFKLPRWIAFEQFIASGPACIFIFHPALGPLHSIIRQKIRNGVLHAHAEMQLEIAEIDIENLELKGSLLIHADSIIGEMNEESLLQYGKESRCILKNVKIVNKGIDHASRQEYWKNKIVRVEALEIILHEGAEFIAEDATFEGDQIFEVPPFHCLRITGREEERKEELSAIDKPSWQWRYSFNERDQVILSKVMD